MRKSLFLTVAAASLLATGFSALAAGSWVPANVPSGGSGFSMFGINDKNIVTGSYTNASGLVEGTIGPFDGSKYKTIDDGGGATQPRGLNNNSYVMGFDTGTLQQWEWSGGKLTDVTQAGTPVATALAMGINATNVFAGDYLDTSGLEVGATGTKAKYTKVVKLKFQNSGYAARGIDSAGDVAGWYYDPTTGLQRGYIIMNGTALRVDYPKAQYTVIEGLNDKGMASGQWEDASSVIHGFVYNIATKKFKSLDAPGASFTQVWGINNHNVVAVSAAEADGTDSFAYCMSAKGCPSGGAAWHVPPASGKAVKVVPAQQ